MSATSVLSDSDKELETRFAHLLNPIRDLAKNWDVDIASLLEKYLNELEAVTITFDGGKTTMNFVQAAMLIQGSTSVYSRKVEFLYMLVQEMLQLLAKKKKSQPTSVTGQDKDSSLEKEASDDFLTLDDVAVNKNVDLKDGGNSKKKASLLPNTPTFFVPLDESEKGDMLFSPKGEQIGNKNDFKLGIGVLHPTGMLLLDIDNGLSMDPDGKITPTETDAQDDAPMNFDNDCGPPSPAMSVQSFGGAGDIGNDLPMQMNQSKQNENINLDNKSASESMRYNLRARKQNDVLHDINRMATADPYEDLGFKDRPFRKGNVFRILDELEPKNTKKRKTRKVKEKLDEPLTKLSNLSDASKFVKDALKIPTFVELNRMYWQEQKERQKNLPNLKEILPANIRTEEAEYHSDVDEGICDDYAAGGDFGCEMANSPPPADNKPNDIDKLVGCTYEDLVREHVENFMSSAQKYVQVTELAKRVQEWEERIVPILEHEEEMEPFDIHQYGSKVLNRFSFNNRKQTLTFRKIVEKEEKREVARFFLASLQLANSYNVAISKQGELESSINTMELTLLSRVRHHEQLDDYVAPSLQAIKRKYNRIIYIVMVTDESLFGFRFLFT
uniref:Condensin-2 complex subunit H2 n=1 Tax=Strigamia maritima TaxID=126957 RepID=T1JP48_STRMM